MSWVEIIAKNDLSQRKPCIVGNVVSPMADSMAAVASNAGAKKVRYGTPIGLSAPEVLSTRAPMPMPTESR